MLFFKGTEADVIKAASKEEWAIRYCYNRAFEANQPEDGDLWDAIATHMIHNRSRYIYKMDAKLAIEDARRIYEPDELDKQFIELKKMLKFYGKTVENLVNSWTSPINDELEAYIEANYVPA